MLATDQLTGTKAHCFLKAQKAVTLIIFCAEVAEVLRIIPKFSLEFLAKTWSIKNKADIEKYVEPLRQAGLK